MSEPELTVALIQAIINRLMHNNPLVVDMSFSQWENRMTIEDEYGRCVFIGTMCHEKLDGFLIWLLTNDKVLKEDYEWVIASKIVAFLEGVEYKGEE